MQEEVENRTVNLAITTTRLTVRTIIAGIRKFLQYQEKKKAQKVRDPAVHGKQSVKKLLGQNQGAANAEIEKEGIKDFERLAKKYGVDFAVRKDKSVDPPRYFVFVRAKDSDALDAICKEHQARSMTKDKNADTIIGNMDSRIFLGGSEPTTLKELNQALGKETIDTFNTSNTRGNSPSYGMNYQKLGKDLASVDELAVLDGSKCILQLRGVRPFLSDKYDLTQHPNFKLTADYDKRNEFKIEEFLSHRLRLKADDEFVVVDAD